MDPLRIGLIGYGNWARLAFLPALREDGRGRIVAAAAPTRVTQQRIREELGSQVQVYPHFEALLSHGDLDAVLMALPVSLHAEAIVAAVSSGIPFLYEPPLANRLDEIPAVMRRLLAARQITQADLEPRFIPVVAAAASLLGQGMIGEPQLALIKMNGTWDPSPDAQISLSHALIPWYVDVLDRVLGSHPGRVFVQDGRGAKGRMQSYGLTQLDYDGVWGTFYANISAVQGSEAWIEISGRDGDLFCDLFTGELKIRNRKNPEWKVEQVVSAQTPYAGWPGLRECLEDFLDGVTGQPFSGVSAEDMARLQLVGLAAEESIDSEGWALVGAISDLL